MTDPIGSPLIHSCMVSRPWRNIMNYKRKGNVEAWNEYAATTKPGTSADYGKKEEERVITGVEQTTAQALGEVEPGKVTRTDHSGSYVWVNGPTSNKPI